METMTGSTPPRDRGNDVDLSALPSVGAVVESIDHETIAVPFITAIVRDTIASARSDIEAGASLTRSEVVLRCQRAVSAAMSSRFGETINGTGVILHTNLGRSPVSIEASEAMAAAAAGYVPVEIDPATNRRGGRMDDVAGLLRLLTGADATLVVNNNAAAILLTLSTLAAGREVIVSRGEAVEIGGGFRIPDVVRQGGCRLIEVGTTNRTYVSDYRSAVTESTAAILRVHPGNFRTIGFTAAPSTQELAALARESELPLIEDLGSGALIDTERFGLDHEPTVAECLSNGASVVTFSGDKLIGGPQSGFICGRSDLIAEIERHPLARAVRVDKVTLAGIVATLRHYLAGEAQTSVPVWSMIGASIEELRRRGTEIVRSIEAVLVDSSASIGGGSLPGQTLPSVAISIASGSPDELARALRTGTPRVFPVIREGAVLIDLRTVLPAQDLALASALERAFGQ